MEHDTGPEGRSEANGAMRVAILAAAKDVALVELRTDLAHFTAEVFKSTGLHLHVGGWIVGPDRVEGRSPFGNGSDETVAISVLLRIAEQLVSGSVDLFEKGHAYAAAALLRQLVEVEYLAWAFEARNGDGERWLRSSQDERRSFFSPIKLRKASEGKFRGEDYGFHCENGGHPVPSAGALLNGDEALVQLLIADLLGHAGRIWDHLVGWAGGASHGEALVMRSRDMSERYGAWKALDPLAKLPPPPLTPRP
jgi:hypothetical protein